MIFRVMGGLTSPPSLGLVAGATACFILVIAILAHAAALVTHAGVSFAGVRASPAFAWASIKATSPFSLRASPALIGVALAMSRGIRSFSSAYIVRASLGPGMRSGGGTALYSYSPSL